MSKTLRESITTPDTRPTVVTECTELVESEVKGKGFIVRGAYATVKKIKPGFVKGAIDGLLDDWVEKMEPYYGTWQAAKSGNFADHLVAHKEKVADDLLSVTDARAASTDHKTAAKAYKKLRPTALKNVVEAIPGLGAIIEKHL